MDMEQEPYQDAMAFGTKNCKRSYTSMESIHWVASPNYKLPDGMCWVPMPVNLLLKRREKGKPVEDNLNPNVYKITFKDESECKRCIIGSRIDSNRWFRDSGDVENAWNKGTWFLMPPMSAYALQINSDIENVKVTEMCTVASIAPIPPFAGVITDHNCLSISLYRGEGTDKRVMQITLPKSDDVNAIFKTIKNTRKYILGCKDVPDTGVDSGDNNGDSGVDSTDSVLRGVDGDSDKEDEEDEDVYDEYVEYVEPEEDVDENSQKFIPELQPLNNETFHPVLGVDTIETIPNAVVEELNDDWTHAEYLIQHGEGSIKEPTYRYITFKNVENKTQNTFFNQLLYHIRQIFPKIVFSFKDDYMRWHRVQISSNNASKLLTLGLPDTTKRQFKQKVMDQFLTKPVEGKTFVKPVIPSGAQIRQNSTYFISTHPEIRDKVLGNYESKPQARHNIQAFTVPPIDANNDVLLNAMQAGVYNQHNELYIDPSGILSMYTPDFLTVHSNLVFEYAAVIHSRMKRFNVTSTAPLHTWLYNVVDGELWKLDGKWSSGDFHPRRFSMNDNLKDIKYVLHAYYHAIVPAFNGQQFHKSPCKGWIMMRQAYRECLNYWSRVGIYVSNLTGEMARVKNGYLITPSITDTNF
jgi:hypothetical protein